MEDLKIEKIGDNILEITLNDWNKEDSAEIWSTSISLIAEKIFASDQDQTVIVLSPIDLAEILDGTEWSDLLKSKQDNFKQQHHLTITKFMHNNDEYVITTLYNPPSGLIDELVHHYLFTLSNMFLFKRRGIYKDIDDDLRADFREIISNNNFVNMPKLKSEMLGCSDDGCVLFWFNSSSKLR